MLTMQQQIVKKKQYKKNVPKYEPVELLESELYEEYE